VIARETDREWVANIKFQENTKLNTDLLAQEALYKEIPISVISESVSELPRSRSHDHIAFKAFVLTSVRQG
jgi:hypothetical protein